MEIRYLQKYGSLLKLIAININSNIVKLPFFMVGNSRQHKIALGQTIRGNNKPER